MLLWGIALILPLVFPSPEYQIGPSLEAPLASPRQAEVIDLLKKGQTDLAISKARDAVKEAPTSAVAHDLLGIALSVNAQWSEAELEFREAVRLDPRSVDPRLHLGQLFQATKRLSEAVDQFEKTRDLAPQSVPVRRVLALAYVRQGAFPKAVAELEEGVRISQGKDLDAKFLLAGLYQDMGRLVQAEKLVGEVLAANPGFVPGKLLQAVLQVEQGKPDAAMPALRDVIEKDPKSLWGHLALGMAYRMKGQYKESIVELEQVTKEQPKWDLAQFQLGETYLAQGDLDRAMKAYDQAEQASPDLSVAKLRVGESLLAKGETDRAQGKGDEVLILGKASPQAHIFLARVYMAKKAPDQAERELKAAMAEAPDSPGAGVTLATFYRDTGKLDKAEATLNQVVRKFPNDPSGHYQLGLLAVIRRKDREAVPFFEKAVKLQPDSSVPLLALAESYSRLGEKFRAVALAERVVNLEGASSRSLVFLGTICERALDFPAAEKAYRKALVRDGKNLQAGLGLAGVLDQQGKKGEALRVAEETARAHPRTSSPLVTIGRLQEAAGNASEAITAYRKALEVDQDNAVALNNLAWLLGKDGQNLDEAITLAEKAYGKAPDSPSIADTLGWLLYRKGNVERAEALIKAAVAGDSKNPSLRYHLGMVYAKEGKTREALREFDQVIKASPNTAEVEAARQMVKSLSSKK